MNATPTWEDFESRLNERSKLLYKLYHRKTSMIGVALAPEDVPGVQSVIKAMGRWNFRSGDKFDIYWPGYAFANLPFSIPIDVRKTTPDPSAIESLDNKMTVTQAVFAGKYTRDEFRIDEFYEFVDRFHEEIGEHSLGQSIRHLPNTVINSNNEFSGEFDIFFMDTIFDVDICTTLLDLESTMVVHVNHLHEVHPNLNANTFLERLARFDVYSPEEHISNSLVSDLDLATAGLKKGPTAMTVLSTTSQILGSVAAGLAIVGL